MAISSPAEPVFAVSILYGRKARHDLFDDFLARRHIEDIAARAAAGGDVEITEYDAREFDPAALLDELRTPAMFSSVRMLLLNEAQRVLSPPAGERATFEPFIKALLAYCQAPGPGRLILIARALEVNRGAPRTAFGPAARLLSAAAKASALFSCVPPYKSRLPAVLSRRAAAQGVKLNTEAAGTLVSAVGTDQNALQQEMEKLIASAGPTGKIRTADIAALVADRAGGDVFELADAVLERDFPKALKLLNALRLMPATRSGALIIAGLAGSFRRALAAAKLIDGGTAPAVAAEKIGVPQFVRQAFVRRLAGWDPSLLSTLLSRALQCDAEIKTGSLQENVALETFLSDACARGHTKSPLVGRWIYEV